MRSHLLTAVLLLVCVSGSAAEPPRVSQLELYRPFLERAIAAGMPDVRGATFWTGTWVAERNRPKLLSHFQGFSHLHLRLANGRWLMRGIYLRPAAKPEELLEEGFSQIAADAEGTVTKTLDWVENPLLEAVVTNDALLPLAHFAGLRQAGHPQHIRYGSGITEYQWTTPVWTPQGQGPAITIETDARRELHLVLLRQALGATTAADVQAFTTAALALLSDEERPLREAAVRRLVELPPRSDVPQPMPTAVQIVQEWDGERATWPQDSPLSADQLIALLDDHRPARRLNWTLPGTLSDGACDILTKMWGFHPRQVSGRDAKAPWTPEERHLTALAVQAWWRDHHDQSLLTAVLADPATLPLLWTSYLGNGLTPEQCRQAAAAVTNAWAALDQHGRDALPVPGLEVALNALGDDPALDHLVRSWPVQGPLRLSLGLWHELHDDYRPLTDHLREALNPDPALPPLEDSAKEVITSFSARTADQERCDLLVAAYQAAPGTRPFTIAHAVACSDAGSYSRAHPLLRSPRCEDRTRCAIGRALRLIGLWDERMLPASESPVPMRVCDSVGYFTIGANEDGTGGFDLALPIAERDRLLEAQRAKSLAALPTIMKAAGLTFPQPLAARLPPAVFPPWWQAELDAAQAEKKAIALLLTDTVHCAPCVRLEREILTQPAWTAWATTHLRMIVMDESKHRDDEEWGKRMLTVARLYELGGGVPSLVIIGADGHRLSPRYSFEPDVGPAWYIAEFTRALAGW